MAKKIIFSILLIIKLIILVYFILSAYHLINPDPFMAELQSNYMQDDPLAALPNLFVIIYFFTFIAELIATYFIYLKAKKYNTKLITALAFIGIQFLFIFGIYSFSVIGF